MKNTPEIITEVLPNQVVVVGTNPEGRHGAGAAKWAMQFGLKYGIPMGLQGQAYGIVTQDLRVNVKDTKYKQQMMSFIRSQIFALYRFASYRPELEFLVTKIGTGLAGFTIEEIAKSFKDYAVFKPDNIVLPVEFE